MVNITGIGGQDHRNRWSGWIRIYNQKQIAKLLKDELSWDATLQNSQEKLGDLAKEGLHKYKAGKTQQTGDLKSD